MGKGNEKLKKRGGALVNKERSKEVKEGNKQRPPSDSSFAL